MIKFERDEITRHWMLYIGENTFIHTTTDWEQFYRLLTGKSKYNWYTFHLINAYFENDIICPGIEIEIALLGLGLRFRHKRSWKGTEIQSLIDDTKEAIETGNMIPGFPGDSEFTDELETAVKSLIAMVHKGLTEREQRKVAGYVLEAMAAIEVDRAPDDDEEHTA